MQSGASAEREKVESLWKKGGRREEETSERGNFETRGEREEIEEKNGSLFMLLIS